MKIISWNVNGAVSSETQIGRILSSEKPDILLLQEIRCDASTLAYATKVFSDNYAVYVTESDRRGHYGVATIVRRDIIPEFDDPQTWLVVTRAVDFVVEGHKEGRICLTILNGVAIINSYSINVRKDLSRIAQRVAYDDHLMSLMKDIENSFGITDYILMGDLNVVAESIDCHSRNLNPSSACMTPSERAKFIEIKTKFNLVDAYRHLHPDKVSYTFYSYIGGARNKGLGWRLDYALVSEALIEGLKRVETLDNYKSSDHVPLQMEIKL